MAENPHKGHRARLKRRFLQEGFDHFEEHNMLELILFYAVPQKDTNELAHLLIDRFGSLNKVLDAPYEELLTVSGVGENTATYLKIISQTIRAYYNAMSMDTSDPIFDTNEKIGAYFIHKFMGCTEECIYVLFLDSGLKYIRCELIATGTLTSATLDIRKIVEYAIRYQATNVVLAHNHPNTSSSPSNEDVITTNYIQTALGTIDVKLIDHFIVSGKEYTSLYRLGYI